MLFYLATAGTGDYPFLVRLYQEAAIFDPGIIAILPGCFSIILSRIHSLLCFLYTIVRLFLWKGSFDLSQGYFRVLLFHLHGDTSETSRAYMQHASIWTYHTHANNCKISRRPGLRCLLCIWLRLLPIY